MIAVIDYKAGNVASITNALERLGKKCVVTSDPDEILFSDGVVFPGQGRAGSAMAQLKKTGVDECIAKIKKPFLGICLGMQLLVEHSEEDDTKCLGIFPGLCHKFPPGLKIPHIGWNKVEISEKSPLTEGMETGTYFYFVHSYFVDTAENFVMGKTAYGFDFTSIMRKDNFFAVQFHPEKSGQQGLRLLENFCKLCN